MPSDAFADCIAQLYWNGVTDQSTNAFEGHLIMG
jgi:hypothetical protein